MSEWKAKRFWELARVEPIGGGFAVMLDQRRLNTPGKHPLLLPSRALADGIAAEWNAQEEEIAPLTMPLTRAANSAIERVQPKRSEVAAMLSAYGETDLLCYRAEGPSELVERQRKAWDPLLEWAAERLDAPLRVVSGVLPVEQPADSIRVLADEVDARDSFELTGLHDLVTLTGSLVLGLAVDHAHLTADEAWSLSRIDEDWQSLQWGEDAEAAAAANAKRDQLRVAANFLELLRSHASRC